MSFLKNAIELSGGVTHNKQMIFSFSEMTKEDLPEVMRMERECFASPWTKRMFKDELESPVSRIILARGEEGALMGFVCLWVILDEAHILNVAVKKRYRRQGIGRALVLEALRRARELGARMADLEVRSRNTAALRLYEGLGFRLVGFRKGYYDRPDDDAALMSLSDIVALLEESP